MKSHSPAYQYIGKIDERLSWSDNVSMNAQTCAWELIRLEKLLILLTTTKDENLYVNCMLFVQLAYDIVIHHELFMAMESSNFRGKSGRYIGR